jgi:hypothetical protein
MATAAFLVSLTCWAGGLDTPDDGAGSIHPLWLTREQHPVEERLLGNWSTYYVFDWGFALAPIPVRLRVTANRETGEYELTFSPEPEIPDKEHELPRITLRGFLVSLKGQLYLDLTAVDKPSSLHRVFLVILNKGIPRLIRWRFYRVADEESGKIGISKDSVAGGSTKHLRKFVIRHANDVKVFPTAGEECDESCIGNLPDEVFPLLPEGTVLVPHTPADQ